jgi:ribosomal protein S18 acetylase RimI-like enzyme
MRDLLQLRHATPADKEALAAFNVRTHRSPEHPTSSAYLDRYTRDLFERPHPVIAVSDHLMIEDTATGAIVSTVQLIRQTWTYAGLPLRVGQIELVGTDPVYRRRGLVRRLIAAAHARSEECGDLVQMIGGKPNFYRQFGYTYALELGGGRRLIRSEIPALPAGTVEPFVVRPAVVDDASFLAAVDEAQPRRYRVTCPRDATLWRYELAGRSADNAFQYHIRIITQLGDTPVGYLVFTRASQRGARLRVIACALLPQHSWLAVAPRLARFLDGAAATEDAGDGAPFTGVYLGLGSSHPLYDALPSRLWEYEAPSAAYLRVAHIAALLRQLAPALEARLSGTVGAGYSGDLWLSWYHGGVRLHFTDGRIADVSDWMPDEQTPGDAAFPADTLVPVIFGFRSVAEIQSAYPDCALRSDVARALLPILFPLEPSRIWSIV